MKDAIIIGFEAHGFTEFPPGVTPETIKNGLEGAIDELRARGQDGSICWIRNDSVKNAVDKVIQDLKKEEYRVVVIGAGIRIPKYFEFMEHVINAVHEYAPKSKIAFNQGPTTNIEAIDRWL